MALNFTGFKQKLFSLMKVNETEDKAYQLSYAGGNSGYSYGWVQFDLASGPKIGKETFEEILKNATDSSGNKIISSGQVDALFKAAQTRGGTDLTSEQIALINAALSSDYGKTAVDDATSTHLDNLITYADSWVTKAPADDKAFLQSDLGKLWLCDVKNQGFVPVTSKPEQFESFLQGQAYRGYTKQGTLSFDDILQVYFRQRQAANFEPWDPFRRLSGVVEAAGGYAPADLDEAKGVLRAYTYYYVRNENKLISKQTYLDSVNAFRNKVNAPAEQMMLDNWKSEWGPRPASVADYDDMLMGDDKANMSDSGDYQLNGRDGDDIIFGEGGNDRIEGGKGNDILIGGEGNDTLIGGEGNDVLSGGNGVDTYIIEGNDRIIDSDGKGIVKDKNGNVIAGAFTKQADGSFRWVSNSQVTATKNSPLTLYLPDGSTVVIEDYGTNGDFGIHLLDTPSDPEITNTIIVDEQYSGTIYDTPANDLIVGTSGDDGIIGGWHGGNDWVLGGDGSDAISTGAGIVEGGAGSDIIAGGHDDSKLFGENYGEMEDLITAGESAPNINTKGDLVSGNDGNDQVYGSNANDALFGGYGHDLLVGGGGDDAIFGDGECSGGERNWSFTITPGVMVNLSNMVYGTGTFKGNDAIYAGMGNDFVYAGGGGDEVDAGAGDDTVIGEGGDDFIDGSTGNDILEGDAPWVSVDEQGSDYIDGGSGNDKIWGGAGSDDMFGGDGNDEIYGDNTDDIGSGDDYLDGEAGDDKLVGYGGDDAIFGGDGNDYLEGDNGTVGSGNDYLDGEAGNDTLLGNAGNDEMFGGTGNDWLQGDEGDDYLDGEAGDDTIIGVDGDDEIYGGAGNDQIWGGNGADTYVFNIGDGKDTIYDFPQLNSSNSDTIQFGEGIRKEDIDFVKDGDDLEIRIKETEDSIRVKNWFYLENNRTGQSEFADGTMLTSADIDAMGYKVYGTAGDDTLFGSGSADKMYGYEGNDYIAASDGNDMLYGDEGNDSLYGYDGNDMLYGGIGNDSLSGYSGNDMLNGEEGDDQLYGDDGIDTLNGGAGNDSLYGWWGDDVLDGGVGNDHMIGGSGTDIYRFGIGSGQDTINDYGHGDITGIIDRNKIDTLEFSAGIIRDDLELIRDGDDLKINIKGATDTLTIQNWFNHGDYYRVEQFKFSDGTVLTAGEIEAAGYNVPGTASNDTLEGGLGSDTLDGGMGDDNLYGDSGNDVLDGGIGNDTLEGGYGSDVYKFGLGSGQDTIYEYDGVEGIDTVEFGYGITKEDVEFHKSGSYDLQIRIKGATDTLTIHDWFSNDSSSYGYRVEQFKFSDGTILTDSDIIRETISPTEGDDILYGGSGNDNLQGLGGNDTLYGLGNNDTLQGGSGDDYMEGSSGDDILMGGEGNDTLVDTNGINVLDGGPGEDHLIGSPEAENTYIVKHGGGFDTVTVAMVEVPMCDTVAFGEEITPDDLSVQVNDNAGYGGKVQLAIGIDNDEGILIEGGGYGEEGTIIDEGMNTSNLVVQHFAFADGQELTLEEILARADNGVIGDQWGTEGDDFLRGSVTDDFISGGDGNDRIEARERNDFLEGGTGDDILDGGSGADTMIGGAGNDTYIIDNAGDVAIELSDEGNDTVYSGIDYTLGSNIENLTLTGDAAVNGTGNNLDNIITGNNTANILTGGGGNDTVTGGKGNDILNGGEGDDTYIYNIGDGLDMINDTDGTDTLQMGSGLDFDHTIIRIQQRVAYLRLLDAEGNETSEGMDITLNPDGSIPVETINFADGSSFSMNDLIIQQKTIYGTKKSDTIRTGRHDDTIYAGKGGDTVYAGLSNDTIFGEKGNDKLYGEQGNDIIYGAKGNDLLDGGNGNDILYGGKGKDTLIGGKGDDIIYAGKGKDTIIFNRGDGHDTIKAGDGQWAIGDRDDDGNDGHEGHEDRLKFDVNPLDLIFSRSGSDLEVVINGGTDRITIEDWYEEKQAIGDRRWAIGKDKGEGRKDKGKDHKEFLIDEFRTTDGRHLHDRQVEQLIQAMATFSADNGMSWSDAIQQRPQDVNQILTQYWSDDGR